LGGTGKTPLVEYLVYRYFTQYKIAILSRGYGRKSQGFRWVNTSENAHTVGDEPWQYFQKFGDQIPIAVCEKRVDGAQKIFSQYSNIQILILDDALQHRAIDRDINLLITDFAKPFFQDFVLPMGTLRESRWGARRANLVIVSKCPETLSKNKRDFFIKSIQKYVPKNTPILFTYVAYPPQKFPHVLLVTGIAQPLPLVEFVRQNADSVAHLAFADHHRYSPSDWEKIQERFAQLPFEDKVLVTTEKDFTKLQALSQGAIPWRVVSISPQFLGDDSILFDNWMSDFLRTALAGDPPTSH
jgi:tetraacyldisaccharide 4'-kinase